MSFLDAKQTAIVLAPMEGVMDAPMRALIADLGGFDFGMSEFVRAVRRALPMRRTDIPSLLPNRLRLGIERYAALTQDHAAISGFIPSRVKQWIGMVRDISDAVPRQVLTAVKHARTNS